MKPLLAVITLLIYRTAIAQLVCTAPGQNPSTAFPVCGTATFVQASVPLCGGRALPSPRCPGDGLTDINPFWYKFTCFQSGTLGFVITPNSSNSDYDWELYDVTGRNPNDVYTDGNLVVSCNWSGETGTTGASSAGTQTFVCGGASKPLFSTMPSLQAGRNYLLLVSHFTNNQSGYKLSFGGGTAVITDPTDPHLQKVEANCGGDVLRLKLSKKVRCSSVAGNGSDFAISPGGIAVTGSTGISCSGGFDTDSIELRLSAPLAPGMYTLRIQKGSDNNTLLDYCDRPVAESETLPLTILPRAPTPMDSLVPPACAPTQLRLIFKKPIQCATIAPDGSDFSVSGGYPVAVTAAGGNCAGGLTKEVIVTLSKPLQAAGNFQLVLRQGNDGNTVLDECSEQTPAGSAVAFSVQDTVNADFTYAIGYGCERDTVRFLHPAGNGVNTWSWNLDENQRSSLQNPQALYTVFDQKTVQLAVSNGFCADTVTQIVALKNFLQAGFSVYDDNCPNEAVPFTNSSVGKIAAYNWAFGDGGTAAVANPLHTYAAPFARAVYTVRLTVIDSFGCQSTVQKPITVYSSCYLAVPNAFTPNNDGKNDAFRVLNAIKAESLELVVFNRWGQAVFKTADWKQGWDGRLSGNPQPSGVYVWMLRYVNRDTKQRVEQKGTVMLVR